MEQTSNRSDMLTIARLVAREKNIDIEHVINALESAIQKSAMSKYGAEFDIRAKIDMETGVSKLYRYTEIVSSQDEVENDMKQVPLELAKVSHPDLEVGDFIIEDLPPLEFGRIASQTAKQVIIQKVREAERDKQYEEFKDRIGEIVVGTVKRSEYNMVSVDIGNGEAIIRHQELINREQFRRGDRIKAYVLDVRREQRGPQVFLSRTNPNFLIELFRQEVPEIDDGIIEIVKAVREPGSRAKILVTSTETGLDPVGSCVGMRGSRVQAVVSELMGEKIDIIEYVDNLQQIVKKSLQPAQVTRVVENLESKKIEVIVPDDQLSLAIGSRGQNVRLASQLLGQDLDIITEEQEQERREQEYKVRSQVFIENLGVSSIIARLLVTEGFTSIEDIALIPFEEFESIQALEELAADIHSKAKEYMIKEANKDADKINSMKIQEDLIEFFGGESLPIIKMGENDVKSLEDLADLSSYELQEILEEMGITQEESENIIMQAREKSGWFDDEEEQQ